MKKRVLISMLLVIALLLGACGNGKEAGKETGNGKEGDKKIRVALVLAGFLGDKSFNDSAYEGVERALEEFGEENFEIKVLESKVAADWETNLITMANDGYDLVLGISTQLQEIIEKHAKDYPDVKFGIIDGVVKGDNVVSATFAQNEGSFLAGAAATMFTTKTEIENVNEEKVIGWVGGMDVPVLRDFLTGYEQGAKYIDPDVKILSSFAGTFNDPLKGKELTLAQYSQGADIVMNVASNTGNGILEAANDTGNYAIGVDLDQDSVYPGRILTSMLKRVDVASYEMIKSVYNNEFEGNKTLRMDVASDGVGLTDMSVIKESLGDKFPEDILEKVAELSEAIKSGEIVVESYEGFETE
ncbi:MAG: BMP family ABC transporter substrate-binding protein [Miniphocaeibacter sp.]|uniref:BMP family ABC transporter substrate-binding protein n=1 Tax=Miniphocaeibacter sp. TaxID=3100973 RepID=UPI0017AEB862|nr:BMP family ABC transporter substrate-binding protein [Gallicola sp.]